MKVMKFGGTSVGSAERMKNVAALITRGKGDLAVLSAMSGTTNSLVDIAGLIYARDTQAALDAISCLVAKYDRHIAELYSSDKYRGMASDYIHGVFDYLSAFPHRKFTSVEEKIMLSQGELISTHMMYYYLQEQGIDVVMLPALDYMRLDMRGEPDSAYISEHIRAMVSGYPDAALYLTQGFICRNARDEVDNLKRGGSDYSASLVGAAVCADEIQIWTDIDGMHNNDPRVVEGTKAVRHLSFDEAAELGYFGAKILHPTCILPARLANIPVRLLNTMDPSAPGTLIDNRQDKGEIKAVAAKDNITAIHVKSSRMLLAYGFLRKVFEIFESWQTPIDMICTSEVGVSMTIDNTQYLNEIVTDLQRYGAVDTDSDMCIICVVGDMDWSNLGFESRALQALGDVQVRMVSYGGSRCNISFLVKEEDKEKALRSLSKFLFD